MRILEIRENHFTTPSYKYQVRIQADNKEEALWLRERYSADPATWQAILYLDVVDELAAMSKALKVIEEYNNSTRRN